MTLAIIHTEFMDRLALAYVSPKKGNLWRKSRKRQFLCLEKKGRILKEILKAFFLFLHLQKTPTIDSFIRFHSVNASSSVNEPIQVLPPFKAMDFLPFFPPLTFKRSSKRDAFFLLIPSIRKRKQKYLGYDDDSLYNAKRGTHFCHELCECLFSPSTFLECGLQT